MSYVALGLGVTGVVVGGTSAYLSSQQQKKAAGGLSYTAPNYGDTQDYLNSNFTLPSYQNYSPTPYTTGYDQYLSVGNKYGKKLSNFLESTNDKSNGQYRKDLYTTSPTLKGNIAQQGANTTQFLQGIIPTDVQAQVQNHAAETSLYGGFGGSQMARNLTARDLGLTSLDLIDRGNQGLQQQLGYAQSLNPYQSDTLQYLMTPAQLQSQAVQQNQFGTGVYNTNQSNYANIANQRATAIANLMKAQQDADAGAANTNNVLQYQQAALPNPYVSGLSTGAGALAAGSYGGGDGATNYSGLINLLSGLVGSRQNASSFNQYGSGGLGDQASPQYL